MSWLQGLQAFLDGSPMAFQAAELVAQGLLDAGYRELREADKWHLEAGGRYFVRRNRSSVVAFGIGSGDVAELYFRLVLSHLDSPGLRLKLAGMQQSAGVLVVPMERYSQNIDSTWLDHPLSVAGRVVLQDGREVLISFARPLAVIPNIGMHLLHELAHGVDYNAQTQLRAVFGEMTAQELLAAIAAEASCKVEDLAAMELGLTDATPSAVVGLKGDLLNAPRLDNLLSAHALLTALTAPANLREGISVGFFADNEEVGSGTPAGANSAFLRDILERIVLSFGGDREDVFCALAKSTMLSVDAAHALHPNYRERFDAATAPVINGGVVLKTNSNVRYATNAVTEAWLKACCREADVPCQLFCMRSDMSCGSTVGPVTASRLGVPAVDIGNAMWAMHSVRETAGLRDQEWMCRLLTQYLCGALPGRR